MTDAAMKPCACERPGCVIVRGDLCRSHWNRRRYRSYSCARYHRNLMPEMQAIRIRAGRRRTDDTERGAIVTSPDWLDLPPVRVRLQRAAEGLAP